jgi:alpha-1,3-fucosyltransferase
MMLSTTYKFYLGFENSFCKDYVTEKFFRVFEYRSHIIPVVRGGFDYDKYFPNGTFINAAHFSTAKDLALYLKDLGNDHVRYAKMLQEKDKLTTVNYKMDWCDICEKVHTDTRTKIIPDIKEWSHSKTCHAPTIV